MSGSRAGGTTNKAAAVANSADEARPLGFAKHSATTESALEVLPREAGSSESRAGARSELSKCPRFRAREMSRLSTISLKIEILRGWGNRVELWEGPRSHARKTSIRS